MPNKKTRNILLFAVIAALAAVVGYWNISPARFLDTSKVVVEKNAIDYYALNARGLQYLPSGKLQYEMMSDKIEHLKGSEVTLLTNPILQIYRDTAYPLHVQSASGVVNPDGSEIELIDSVCISGTDEKNRTTIVTSTRMNVFTQKQYVQTEQDVRIDGAGGFTTARGLKGYLKDGRMELLSNVRGQYESR